MPNLFRVIGGLIHRRHTNKSHGWIKNKYFHTVGKRKWVFAEIAKKEGNKKALTLRNMADIPITCHLEIKMEANLFDADWYGYFETRKTARLRYALANV
ncbi:hypothetical protein KCV26_02205 [Petrimonas sulfuriphila]|uniref:hypothetical protein n=1 Tax=Petrimonas sulfuriphila TaxID=285070 RepID=UPI00324D16C9